MLLSIFRYIKVEMAKSGLMTWGIFFFLLLKNFNSYCKINFLLELKQTFIVNKTLEKLGTNILIEVISLGIPYKCFQCSTGILEYNLVS